MGLNRNGCVCYFNVGINCSGEDRPCKTCGWNPLVELDRLKTLKETGWPTSRKTPWFVVKEAKDV